MRRRGRRERRESLGWLREGIVHLRTREGYLWDGAVEEFLVLLEGLILAI